MVDLANLTEGEFWPLVERARERVLTNDVDAIEALIVGGLPPDEMQAAAWALVQRVRGLLTDLRRVEKARAAFQERLADAETEKIERGTEIIRLRRLLGGL